MRTVTVEVTEENIRDGQQADFGKCPIALAMTKTLGRRIKVGHFVWWYSDSGETLHDWPATVQPFISDFISSFDQGGHVTSFTFDLEVP